MGITEIIIWGIYVTLFIGALFHPVSGILAYLTVYFTYSPEVWWAQSIIATIPRPSFTAMAFLALGCMFHLKKLHWKISRREMELYIFLAVAWIVSLFFGRAIYSDTWMYLEKLTKLFIFLFIFIRIVHSYKRYKIVMWGMVFGGLLLVYQAHTTGGYFDGRLNNVGGLDFREANALASFLAVMVVFLGFEFLHSPIWKKIVCVVSIAGMVNTIILTQSRAVFLGLAFGALFAIPLSPRKKRLAISCSIILGALLFLMLSDTRFTERMQSIFQSGRQISLITDDSISSPEERELNRVDYWRSSLEIFKDHPLGIGVKNFEKTVPEYDPRNPGMDAHNTYVLCYSELGIFGIIIFLVIIFEALFQLRRIRLRARDSNAKGELESHATALTLVLIVYLLGIMMTHSILYSEFLWILLALPICLENAAKGFKRAEAEEKEDGAEALS